MIFFKQSISFYQFSGDKKPFHVLPIGNKLHERYRIFREKIDSAFWEPRGLKFYSLSLLLMKYSRLNIFFNELDLFYTFWT